MGITGFIFLSSGLFLGWSLGAQDASNVFGTAVATRMVRFKTAALVCSVCLMLGAVISGVGAADTLGDLGHVNAIGGSFVTAFAAAFTASVMSRIGLTISVSQAVVGSIIGWNWFSGSVTDTDSLMKMAGTWVACPILGGIFAVILFIVFARLADKAQLSLLKRDALTRTAMVVTGAFGSYALGANNMANVVGVFIPVAPFKDFNFFGFEITAIQQLFFIGSAAVAVGVYTYSYKVMMTVGKGLMPLSPFAAWVVVLSQACVLFIFASEGLEHFLASRGLPTIPLVPVSSTQAVVGAVIGIGLYKGAAKNINWNILLKVMSGWIISPVVTACFCFFSLFIMQNVFSQPVFTPKEYRITAPGLQEIGRRGFPAEKLEPMIGKTYTSGQAVVRAAKEYVPDLTNQQELRILKYSEVVKMKIDPSKMKKLPENVFSEEEIKNIQALSEQSFEHRWELENALTALNPAWRHLPATTLNKQANKKLMRQLELLERTFKWESPV
ncbi:MAG: inorganic phosphate transporter [Alphaproteobacteria bacterium]|jgi:PiT family inorganic phosphate transporter